MKCPVCTQNTPDSWRTLYFQSVGGITSSLTVDPPSPAVASTVSLDYMYCANDECKQMVIRVHENLHLPPAAVEDPEILTRTWLARPRRALRSIDPLVPDPFRTDYLESAAILEASPRMSAVLSRSILADLLKKYAGKDEFGLADRIDSFTAEPGHPTSLTSNLHYFREIADFGAHTQEDKETSGETGEQSIIPVEREEAEWTLDLVDRLFDYFIVQRAKDEKIKGQMDEKIKKAGRKPLRRPTEQEES